jgi:capsular exopolysaccharide synthesis family protein
MTILTQPTQSPRPARLAGAMDMPHVVRRGPGQQPRAGVDPLRVLRRYAWAIIASGILGAIIGTAAFFLLNEFYPLYSGSVVFEVRPGLQKSTDVGTFDTSTDDLVFRIAQTETYILTSRDVLEAALKTQDVRNTQWAKEFYVGTTFNVYKAMDELMDDLGAGVRRSSNLFTLGWTAHHATDIPIVLNAVAQAYMNNRRQREFEVYDKNLLSFESQLQGTQRELANVEGEIASLIMSGGLTTLEDPRWSAQSFQMQELMTKNTELQTTLNISESALHLVRQQIAGRIEPNPEDIARADMDVSVMNFQQSLQYLKSDYREALDRFTDAGHPQVLNAERQVRVAEAQLDDQRQRIVLRDLQAKATDLENSTQQLEAALEQNNKEMERVGKLLRDLTGKASELEALRSKREYLQEVRKNDLELIKEAQIMKARADASRIGLAQLATTPRERSFPKMEIVIPLGVLVMMGVTVGLIFLRELVDQRVKSASDLGVLPGVRVLGSIPDAGEDPTKINAPELVVRNHPSSVLAESYRQAAAALLPQLDQTESQTLLLVSGLPEAGTTTVASNLAASAAASGKSVLLIDANFRRPSLGKIMGVSDSATGLGDVLANVSSLDEAIHDVGNGISVMPAGSPSSRVFERLNNGLIDGVLADLRTRFDLVIFDTPPAVVAGDAMMLANKVDAAVLVVRANQEHRGLVSRLVQRLGEARCQLLGVLLNRPRGIAGGYLKKNYAAMAEYARSGASS